MCKQDGNVGIGTAANLNSVLNVYGGTSSGPTSIITCMSANATVGGGAGIFFKTSNNHSLNRYGAQIAAIRRTNDNGSPDLLFKLEQTNATGLVERMRIQGDGKVGIGTVTPTALLDVRNGTVSQNAIYAQSDSSYGSPLYLNDIRSDASMEFLAQFKRNNVLVGHIASDATNLRMSAPAGYMILDGANGTILRDSGSNKIIQNGSYFRPDGNNNMYLGASGQRWAQVYSVLGNFSSTLTVSGTIVQPGNGGGIDLGSADVGNGSPSVRFIGSNTTYNWRFRQNDNNGGDFTIKRSTAGGGTTFESVPALQFYSDQNATFRYKVAIDDGVAGAHEFPLAVNITSSTTQECGLEVYQHTAATDARMRFKTPGGYCRFGMESDGDFFVEPFDGSNYTKHLHLTADTGHCYDSLHGSHKLYRIGWLQSSY